MYTFLSISPSLKYFGERFDSKVEWEWEKWLIEKLELTRNIHIIIRLLSFVSRITRINFHIYLPFPYSNGNFAINNHSF